MNNYEPATTCPEWCEVHAGWRGGADHLISPEDFAPLSLDAVEGTHSRLFLQDKTEFSTRAVRVEQIQFEAGNLEPRIEFWHGQPHLKNAPDSPPVTHYTIAPDAAKALAEALLAAVELATAGRPFRCSFSNCYCGQPVAVEGSECATHATWRIDHPERKFKLVK